MFKPHLIRAQKADKSRTILSLPAFFGVLLLLVWLLSGAAGQGAWQVAAAFATHEAGHGLAGRLVKIPLQLTVCGLRPRRPLYGRAQAIVAAAGPAANLLAAWLLPAGWRQAQLALMLLNLLPMLPLDGGVLLRFALCYLGQSSFWRVSQILRTMTLLGALIACGWSILLSLPQISLAAFYLLFLAERERKNHRLNWWLAILHAIDHPTRVSLYRGSRPPLTVEQAISQITPGRLRYLPVAAKNNLQISEKALLTLYLQGERAKKLTEL